jgi:hypothetical protein
VRRQVIRRDQHEGPERAAAYGHSIALLRGRPGFQIDLSPDLAVVQDHDKLAAGCSAQIRYRRRDAVVDLGLLGIARRGAALRLVHAELRIRRGPLLRARRRYGGRRRGRLYGPRKQPVIAGQALHIVSQRAAIIGSRTPRRCRVAAQ